MRFHVVALPHTEVTREYESCAYTQKVRKFCAMMMSRGHTVFLYSSKRSIAPCTEHITVIRDKFRQAALEGLGHYTEAKFDASLPHWRVMNLNAIAKINERAQPGDFLCLIAGIAQQPIADALPNLRCVEFGIGYSGTFSQFRVFESYAWMHTIYGSQHRGDASAIDGRWYDAVIPNAHEVEDFPFEVPEDYFLYLGRLIDRKGFNIAVDACKAAGARLVIAGPGTPPAGADYRGVVKREERGRLLSRARAVFMPTIYLEPFGGVAIEAMMCGTPVISTDWGAFTETVVPGLTGFRCRDFQEFVAATQQVGGLDRAWIRKYATARYGLDAVGEMYDGYFRRLAKLDRGGSWYGPKAATP